MKDKQLQRWTWYELGLLKTFLDQGLEDSDTEVLVTEEQSEEEDPEEGSEDLETH